MPRPSRSRNLPPVTPGAEVTYRKRGKREKRRARCFMVVDGVAQLLGEGGYITLHPGIYEVLDVRPFREG